MTKHLIYNISIYTMDKNQNRAKAMVWEDDTILELGEKSILEKRHRPTRIIDGKGTTLLPGFIDPHIHFFDGALFKGRLDCSPDSIPDIPSLVSAVAGLAETQTGDAWVVGHGYDPQAFADYGAPTRYDLDKACSEKPVAIFHYSMHECVVNSKALTLLGIDNRSPQPQAGEIVKDHRGKPTGRLVEMPQGLVVSKVKDNLMTHGANDIKKRLKAAQNLVLGYGITCIGDPAVSSSTRIFYEQAFAEGVLSLPIVIYPCDDENFFALPSARAAQPIKPLSDKRLTIGPLKIFLDGADRAAMRLSPIQGIRSTFQAFMRTLKSRSLDPIKLMLRSPGRYKKGKLHFGISMVTQQTGMQCVKQAIENRYSLAFHAIGNQAVEQATELMRASGQGHKSTPPPRIEHGLFLTSETIEKIKARNMAVVTQPAFLDHMGKDNLPPLPGFRLMPLRSLLDAGIRVAGSSDWPVVSCNPMLGIGRAVTRITETGEPVQLRQAITVQEAISMYTRDAAKILGKYDHIGSLEPGKQADFILLFEDPFKTPVSELSKLKVAHTYLGGKSVF